MFLERREFPPDQKKKKKKKITGIRDSREKRIPLRELLLVLPLVNYASFYN